MFEELNKRRQAVAANIAKSFENDIEKALGAGYGLEGDDGDNVEKAHQVGDIHPNGKWVWTQLPSGKFDWRTIKKNATEKKQEDGKGNRKVKIDENEYKKQYDVALKQLISGKDEGKDAVDFALNISRSNISKTKKELKELKENRPGAKKAIQKLESDLVKFSSQEKGFVDALKDAKSGSTLANKKQVPSGKKINFDDDVVEVYDASGHKVYSGILDNTSYKDEDYKWNDKDKNYDLPHGYKMVGK